MLVVESCRNVNMWIVLALLEVLFALCYTKGQNFDQYIWKQRKKDSSWSECSVSCGEGYSDAIFTCYDVLNEVHVDEGKCKQSEKPVLRRVCKLSPCANSKFAGYWFQAEWGECSVTCGTGVQSTLIACINHAGTSILDDNQCPKEKPISYKICKKNTCPLNANWVAGIWSKCSRICGGTRTRKVLCKADNGRQVHESNCKETKPIHHQECNQPCARWIVGEWGKCKFNKRKRSCSDAKQTRCVLCVDTQSFKLTTGCSEERKPNNKRDCGGIACMNIK